MRHPLWLAALAAAAGAVYASSSSHISVTVQQSIHVGDAIKFQWTGGTPPYTLKVYLDDKVVSQNQGWTTNYVQWRASPDQVPAGTSVRVRVTDSSGQTVMSEPTVVEGDGKSASTRKSPSDANPSGHDKTSAGDKARNGGSTKSFMDDPNNRFSISDDLGTPTSQAGGGMLSAAVMPSDWQPGQGLSRPQDSRLTMTPLASASLSAFVASATIGASSGDSASNSAAITDAMASTAVTASASNAAPTDVSNIASSTSPTDTASAAASSDTGSSSSSSSSGKLSATALIAIAVVIILLLAAGGGFWWWRSKQKDSDDQQQQQKSGAARKGRSKRRPRRSGNSSESGGDEEKLVGGRGGRGNPSDSETEASEDEASKDGRRGGGRASSYRDDAPSDSGSGTDDGRGQGGSPRRSR
ncbi:hypothetical protein Rt10032_c01g0012 [Rhodotorula toruloides]|uniref:Uncharacterized protein n=1 Tax=Rhodotorula toruloides TaxID=5286 RepID=A0A511K7K5_RHOTO|nr:hypothetical protein Rt10032_c01g0012 [Rhodotorula toruloides]